MNPSRISRQSEDVLGTGINLLSAQKPGTLPQCGIRSSTLTVHGETSKCGDFLSVIIRSLTYRSYEGDLRRRRTSLLRFQRAED